MVGVWMDPVTAQVMMTLLMARGLPLVFAAPHRRLRRFYPSPTGLDKRRLEQGLQQLVERGLALEAGARRVAEADPAVLDRGFVGEAAEGLEHARIGFAAAKGKPAGDGERQQVAAVGQEAAWATSPPTPSWPRCRWSRPKP